MKLIGFETLSITDAQTGEEQDSIAFAALTKNGNLI
jgi:hypothetical protein